MLYYKVNKNADQVRKSGKVGSTDILIKNELYTKKEIEKIAPVTSVYVTNYLTAIEIPKNDTYFLFGARFCKQYPYNS
jgi:hypothetical protein